MENHHHHSGMHHNSSKEYQVQLRTQPHPIEAGSPAQLVFSIKEDGQHVMLDVSHEKKLHLIVVSEDLNWFHHIHPDEQADGSFAITETFPNGGKYLLYTDFKPNNADQVSPMQVVEVQGNRISAAGENSPKLVSQAGGFVVTLKNGHDFKSNTAQPLEISIEKDGRTLQESDMQQYLGASAHIVMIGKADKDFLHVHAMPNNKFSLYAETHISKPGVYRIWVQFKTDDQVHTADFTVNVSPGSGDTHIGRHGMHH